MTNQDYVYPSHQKYVFTASVHIVHNICHKVDSAKIHIVLAGDNSCKLTLHLLLNNGNGLGDTLSILAIFLQNRNPLFIRKLLQYQSSLLGIHIKP